MIELTPAERLAIAAKVSYAMAQCQPGEDARSVLSKMYCEFVPDAFPWQGQMMAEELILWMIRCQECFETSLADPDNYAIGLLDSKLRDLPLQRQCQILFETLQGLKAFDSAAAGAYMSTSQTQKLLEGLAGQIKHYDGADEPEPVLRRRRDALLVQLSSSLRDSNLPEHVIGQMLQLSEQPEDLAKGVVQLKSAENMKKAVTAMTVYTMAANGELSGVHETIPMAGAVIFTYQQSQMRRISLEMDRNYITAGAAEEMMGMVWGPCRTMVVLSIVLIGAQAALTAGTTAGVVAGLVSALVGVGLVYGPVEHAMRQLIRAGGQYVANARLYLDDCEPDEGKTPETVELTPGWQDYLDPVPEEAPATEAQAPEEDGDEEYEDEAYDD